MTLRRFALPTLTTVRTGAGLALLAALAAGIAATNTDAVVAGRFTAALEKAPLPTTADVASGADKTLVSGSEAYWLEKRRHEAAGAAIEPAAWSTAPFMTNVTVGSRITVSAGKDVHIFEVVAVTDVAQEPASADQAPGRGTERKIAITCRDLNAPDSALHTFETTVDMTQATAKPARTL